MHVVWYAGAFPAKHKLVARLEFKRVVGGSRFGGEKKHPTVAFIALVLKACPGRMPGQRGSLGVIHTRTLEAFVIPNKAAGFDDIYGNIEAGAKTQDGTDVLGNIGLEKNNTNQCVIALTENGFEALQRPFHGQ